MASLVSLPDDLVARTVPALLAAQDERQALVARSGLSGEIISLTYRELADLSRRAATVLARAGVSAGDRVGIVLDNDAGVEAHLAYHAAHRLGAINVPLSTSLTPPELARMLAIATPAAVITAHRASLSPATLAATLTGTAILALDDEPGPFSDLAGLPPAPEFRVEENDDADWIFSSGTTGMPKAVAMTHGNSVACGQQARHLWGLHAGSVYQSSSPFFTSTGCHANLLATLAVGCSYVVEPAFHHLETWRWVERHRTTSIFLMSGPLLLSLDRLGDDGIAALDLSSLERVVYGGQPMQASFYRRMDSLFRERLGIDLVHVYGLSEAGPTGLMLTPELHRRAVDRCGPNGLSIGRESFNGWTQFEIVADDGERVASGGIGELRLRGPSVMRGYVYAPDASADALAGGWLHTGDMATTDAEGFVYFVDRRKQMIRRGGLNVSSAEVEGVLCEHPAVVEAAAVPQVNRILGEEVRVVVVVRAGSEVGDEELLAHCRERLAPYKVPASVNFVDALPRNAMGRVVKAGL